MALAAVGWPCAAAPVTKGPPTCPAHGHKGAANRSWEHIEKECRDKLEKNRTAAAMSCLDGHFLEARTPGRRGGDFATTLRKLRHDAEMVTWLQEEGIATKEVKTLFRNMYHSARKDWLDRPDKVFSLSFSEDTGDRQLWTKTHNKLLHFAPDARELPRRTVRANAIALEAMEASVQSNGHAVIDRFLTDKALRHLRNHLQRTTAYFYPRPGEHILALLEDGLASPLVAQLADGLRQAFPRALGPLPLTGARAWKADNSKLSAHAGGVPDPRRRLPGPELAQDSSSAAVAVLIWTLPAGSLNGSSAEALVLRPRQADGREGEPEGKGAQASEEGEEDEEPLARVAYRANRAVIWSQDLLPAWQGPGWKEGYLKRGIHFLLSFGWARCDAAE